MARPQAGILPQPQPSRNALFLILRVRDPASNGIAVARVAAAMPAHVQKVGASDPLAKLVSTVGFGPDFWNVISPGRSPAGLRPFRALAAEGRTAPRTSGDLLVHLISQRHDLNFETARRFMSRLAGAVEVVEEVHGFRHLDGRDLTGFLDGTENPKGKVRAEVALIGNEDATFAGGSYVFTQRYVHDLAKWAALPLREQEKVVGRRKGDSTELSERVKSPTAHIARTVIEEDGEELKIVRHSFPYGTVSEAGLFFVAYTRTLDIPEKMLARMIGTAGDGLYDRLLDFSRAVSGANFFAPSLTGLRALVNPRAYGQLHER